MPQLNLCPASNDRDTRHTSGCATLEPLDEETEVWSNCRLWCHFSRNVEASHTEARAMSCLTLDAKWRLEQSGFDTGWTLNGGSSNQGLPQGAWHWTLNGGPSNQGLTLDVKRRLEKSVFTSGCLQLDAKWRVEQSGFTLRHLTLHTKWRPKQWGFSGVLETGC